jgi:hypothetical protein
MHVGGIFCVFTKALDCLNHDSLLSKLRFYGIQGVSAKWFRSCLTDRKQKDIKTHNNNNNFSQAGEQ